ncbi:MAG: transglutaminase family protein [Methylobacterium sp.]|uniref:transglutaminase family protein n=1 Tax=unclassified Methylobacterium TaxID=2615210 RepID=UPI0011CA5080|nr:MULTISPECIES: transglutaminase family protein [unclassified Methylobacterium]MDO9428709.1 transglutaminase family protein [Methylobacterium sp.]TXM71669.1 transglutaminase family protein [Methylobacterium sp. WL69]
MIYTLRHLTTYRYARPVPFARCGLRLRPTDGEGQTVLESALAISPEPRQRVVRRDYFGLDVVAVTIDTPHTELRVESLSRVLVERPPLPDPESGPSWERVRDDALARRSLAPGAPVHYLFPSIRVPLAPEVTDYARASFPPGRSAFGGAFDLMLRIRADFRFDAKATSVRTPLAESFALRAGVCQDFAHIMIAGLRGLGIPAAYVSGYLRTIPPVGRPRLRGADASHAWVSVWCGEGWIGLDPTNGIGMCDDHIVVARGRDYTDVSPIDGIVSSSGAQKLKVEVDVVPDGEPMPEHAPAVEAEPA